MIYKGRAKDGSNGLAHNKPHSVKTSPASLTPFNPPSFSRRMVRKIFKRDINNYKAKKKKNPLSKPEES